LKLIRADTHGTAHLARDGGQKRGIHCRPGYVPRSIVVVVVNFHVHV
jgi:plastocyanin domain-containing protein